MNVEVKLETCVDSMFLQQIRCLPTAIFYIFADVCALFFSPAKLHIWQPPAQRFHAHTCKSHYTLFPLLRARFLAPTC